MTKKKQKSYSEGFEFTYCECGCGELLISSRIKKQSIDQEIVVRFKGKNFIAKIGELKIIEDYDKKIMRWKFELVARGSTWDGEKKKKTKKVS